MLMACLARPCHRIISEQIRLGSGGSQTHCSKHGQGGCSLWLCVAGTRVSPCHAMMCAHGLCRAPLPHCISHHDQRANMGHVHRTQFCHAVHRDPSMLRSVQPGIRTYSIRTAANVCGTILGQVIQPLIGRPPAVAFAHVRYDRGWSGVVVCEICLRKLKIA